MSTSRFSLSALSHKWHSRLMYVLGIQFLIWGLTGLYMVSIDIHAIHGDNRVKDSAPIQIENASYPINNLISRYPNFLELKLKNLLGQSVVQITLSTNPYRAVLFNAETGVALPTLNASQIKQIAQNSVLDKATIKDIQLLNELPDYVSPRFAPAYEVTFNTWDDLSFYIHAQSGEIVTKRHNLWHIFDWMWRFHIMDYDDGSNIHNWFLQLIAGIGLLAFAFGSLLLWKRRRFVKKASFANKAFYKQLLLAHKWIALVVALQLFIWLGSGLYLSLIDKPQFTALSPSKIDWQTAIMPNMQLSKMLANKGPIIEAKLVNVFGKAMLLHTSKQGYHRNFESNQSLIDVSTDSTKNDNVGKDWKLTSAILENYFNTQGIETSDISLLPAGESEIRGENNPVFKVSASGSTLAYYFDAQNGQPLQQYDTAKRIHDMMLRLHFMDYPGTGSFNYVWNIFFAICLVLLSLSGLVFSWRIARLRVNRR